jgi:hypothetical protein
MAGSCANNKNWIPRFDTRNCRAPLHIFEGAVSGTDSCAFLSRQGSGWIHRPGPAKNLKRVNGTGAKPAVRLKGHSAKLPDGLFAFPRGDRGATVALHGSRKICCARH